MNFAVLLVRDLALQALRRSEPALVGKAVALVRGEGRKACIAEASLEAANITPGLAVTLAMARCPGLLIRARSAAAESDAARVLVATAFTLSPRVEPTADGCCTIDLAGVEGSHIDTQMQACVAQLAATGLSATAGAGPTPLLALYAAQRAQSVLIVNDTRDFLAPLPLDVAAPTTAQASILAGWGVTTLGQLTALSKSDTAQRLGTDGVALWERAAGETTRVLNCVEPARAFVAEWPYEPPVESIEPLLFRLRRFADCLALELRAAGMVAEKLSLRLILEDETDYRRDFRLPEPSANVDGWMRVLHGHLETVRTDARVCGVALHASPARPLEKQDGLFESGLRDPAAFWENLARVAALVGDENVGTPVVPDTWRPDAVAIERPADVVPSPDIEPIHPPRGLTLRRFRPPWSAHVTIADEKPTTINASECADVVVAARGPFHLNGEWWKDSWRIELWHVELGSGVVYQLARTGDEWFVEGVFD